jgi:hypothetical protein
MQPKIKSRRTAKNFIGNISVERAITLSFTTRFGDQCFESQETSFSAFFDSERSSLKTQFSLATRGAL